MPNANGFEWIGSVSQFSYSRKLFRLRRANRITSFIQLTLQLPIRDVSLIISHIDDSN